MSHSKDFKKLTDRWLSLRSYDLRPEEMVQKCTELITEIQHTFENEELTKDEDREIQDYNTKLFA
ncbi:hypothetical protein [Nitrosopumilus ureiphilus]|uniref:Uncharacterized protein n=1 Tax=Nitrosopumilus ureiphilus TaxID=1470067 RepID=A0A7D5R896_9ARCH|nr:hypothetical protein [Nitrosopumilus ureiphilus]QLH07399.1 hypothetical protein C5F50_10205 [Nitrosopumilus ureiphilus]